MEPGQIKSIRKALGLTQEGFAKRIGVHKITVSRWERGEISPRGLALAALERLEGRVKAKKAQEE